MKDKTYFLVNCQEMNENHPDSFEIPPINDIKELRVGDFARLIFENEQKEGERMWVQITEIDKDSWLFEGKLTNKPIVIVNLEEDDIVRFGTRHVADYLYKEAKERMDEEYKKTGKMPDM